MSRLNITSLPEGMIFSIHGYNNRPMLKTKDGCINMLTKQRTTNDTLPLMERFPVAEIPEVVLSKQFDLSLEDIEQWRKECEAS